MQISIKAATDDGFCLDKKACFFLGISGICSYLNVYARSAYSPSVPSWDTYEREAGLSTWLGELHSQVCPNLGQRNVFPPSVGAVPNWDSGHSLTENAFRDAFWSRPELGHRDAINISATNPFYNALIVENLLSRFGTIEFEVGLERMSQPDRPKLGHLLRFNHLGCVFITVPTWDIKEGNVFQFRETNFTLWILHNALRPNLGHRRSYRLATLSSVPSWDTRKEKKISVVTYKAPFSGLCAFRRSKKMN